MAKNIYVQLLEKELIPACGCTEPMAFALAAALARKHAPGEIKEIHLKGSGLMVTGVQAVLIPNSHGRHGGFISTAMGVVAGDPDMDMEVLTKITDEDLEKAEALVNRLLAAGAFTQDLAELDHIRYAMKLTQDICQDGIDNPLGMQCGRVLLQNMEKGLVAKDEYNYTLAWTIAGLDARMGGTSYTAMSNTGSGNQGIICTMAPWLPVSGARSLRKRSSAPSPSPT